MKINFVLVTNRTSAYTMARILDLYSFAERITSCPTLSKSVEIIISDNSGDDSKWLTLQGLTPLNNLRIMRQDLCSATEHFQLALNYVECNYCMFLGDDDKIFMPGLIALSRAMLGSKEGLQASAYSGSYLIESDESIGIYSVQNVASEQASSRLQGWLSRKGPNVLYYSAIRIDILRRYFEFSRLHPIAFSFHDQLLTLLILQAGKVKVFPYTIYQYNMANWTSFAASRESDARFLIAAGIDESIESIHWAIGALEGALIAMSPSYSYLNSVEARNFARAWFVFHFKIFKIEKRSPRGESAATIAKVEKFRQKYISATKINFDTMMRDITMLLAESGSKQADEYLEFWRDSFSANRSQGKTD